MTFVHSLQKLINVILLPHNDGSTVRKLVFNHVSATLYKFSFKTCDRLFGFADLFSYK